MPGCSGDHYIPPSKRPLFYAHRAAHTLQQRSKLQLLLMSGTTACRGAFRQVGTHQAAEAAAPSWILCTDVVELSTAADDRATSC